MLFLIFFIVTFNFLSLLGMHQHVYKYVFIPYIDLKNNKPFGSQDRSFLIIYRNLLTKFPRIDNQNKAIGNSVKKQAGMFSLSLAEPVTKDSLEKIQKVSQTIKEIEDNKTANDDIANNLCSNLPDAGNPSEAVISVEKSSNAICPNLVEPAPIIKKTKKTCNKVNKTSNNNAVNDGIMSNLRTDLTDAYSSSKTPVISVQKPIDATFSSSVEPIANVNSLQGIQLFSQKVCQAINEITNDCTTDDLRIKLIEARFFLSRNSLVDYYKQYGQEETERLFNTEGSLRIFKEIKTIRASVSGGFYYNISPSEHNLMRGLAALDMAFDKLYEKKILCNNSQNKAAINPVEKPINTLPPSLGERVVAKVDSLENMEKARQIINKIPDNKIVNETSNLPAKLVETSHQSTTIVNSTKNVTSTYTPVVGQVDYLNFYYVRSVKQFNKDALAALSEVKSFMNNHCCLIDDFETKLADANSLLSNNGLFKYYKQHGPEVTAQLFNKEGKLRIFQEIENIRQNIDRELWYNRSESEISLMNDLDVLHKDFGQLYKDITNQYSRP